MKKLKDPKPGLAKFFSRIDNLGKNSIPFCFSYPPDWKCNAERLDSFLGALPKKRRYAFELRDVTWHNPTIFDLLRCYNAGFCIYELAGLQTAAEITADLTYVRLHGPLTNAYQGRSERRRLAPWARRIKRWRESLKDVYV